MILSRRWTTFWLVWSVVAGAWATKDFAQGHAGSDLICAIVDLVAAAFWARQLWSER